LNFEVKYLNVSSLTSQTDKYAANKHSSSLKFSIWVSWTETRNSCYLPL